MPQGKDNAVHLCGQTVPAATVLFHSTKWETPVREGFGVSPSFLKMELLLFFTESLSLVRAEWLRYNVHAADRYFHCDECHKAEYVCLHTNLAAL